MNFYRHWYGTKEVQEHLLEDVSALGFYSTETNEPIEGKLGVYLGHYDKDPEINGQTDSLYWYKDSLHKCYLANVYEYRQQYGYYYYGNKYRIQISDNSTATDNDSTYPSIASRWGIFGGFNTRYVYGIDNYLCTTEVFFIPLKNGGFILSNKLFSNSDTYVSSYTERLNATPSFKIMPLNEDEGTIKALGFDFNGNTLLTSYTTFIGIPPTNNSIVNDYTYLISRYLYNISNYTNSINNKDNYIYDRTPFIDFQQGNGASQTIFKMHNMYNYSSYQSQNKQYMNFNPNVCILSKVPYDNGFIDNIYYMVTCPTAEISNANYQGLFFSFAGRNFVNIYGNMVLELPGY